MPHFDIVRNNEVKNKSFRVAQLYDQFDIHSDSYQEHFVGDISLPEKWNVGIIVGKSGTGKTTIARELFGDSMNTFEYTHDSVIDDFPNKSNAKDIFDILSSVGFSCPPSWLKPYSVLSNGEKMRVDLARAICENKELTVFDEYTSVVDRDIAKVGSCAVQKAVRRSGKKFIAVSCHYDIIEWLEPDWVFCTDDMTFKDTRGLLRRPQINVSIYEQRGMWKLFRKYHYLSSELNKAARQYVAYIGDKPVAFCAVLYFPHPQIHNCYRVTRLVVLPDYQGIGIGKRMMSFLGEKYAGEGKVLDITTSLKGFAKSLMRDSRYVLIHAGRLHGVNTIKTLNNASSRNRNTYSFRYRSIA